MYNSDEVEGLRFAMVLMQAVKRALISQKE
jgi:hypothetical protein